MNTCYRYEKLEFEEGLFDGAVDLTIVLTIEGSTRYASMVERLQRLKPTKNVLIQVNQGYKKCHKEAGGVNITTTTGDITHANCQAFKMCKGLENVLILEDDFDFDDRIFSSKVLHDVNTFLNNSSFDVFNFGGFGVMSALSTNLKFPKWSLLTVVHAVVYSKNGRHIMNEAYCENPNSTFHDTLHNSWRANIYSYYKPLIYQTWPVSENQKIWGTNTFMKTMLQISKLLQLDKKPQPGFDVMCVFHWSVYILQLYILYRILQRVWKK